MATFKEKLEEFVRKQRGKSEYDAQYDAHQFSREVQEYAPKERWGNIFKYIIAYALGIGLGHALAAALTRGIDELGTPVGIDAEPLAQEIEQGNFDAASFDTFMTEDVGIDTVDPDSIDVGSFADSDDTDVGGTDIADGGEITSLGEAGSIDLGDSFGSVLDT